MMTDSCNASCRSVRLTPLALTLAVISSGCIAATTDTETPLVVVGNWLDNTDNSDTLLNHGVRGPLKTKNKLMSPGRKPSRMLCAVSRAFRCGTVTAPAAVTFHLMSVSAGFRHGFPRVPLFYSMVF
ncbi:hypothetical protein UA45_16860, partial [Morganella morganii]